MTLAALPPPPPGEGSGIFQYSRGYKKRALSGKFYLTSNERKTYFEINFIVFFNRLS
jgi:hypothetical protein